MYRGGGGGGSWSRRRDDDMDRRYNDYGGGGSSGGYRGSGGRGGRSYGRDYDGGEELLSMKVPSRDVGKVIGKGGSKIREFQDESGAYIKVKGESEDDRNATVIDLKGSNNAVHTARRLIEDFLAEMNNRY